MKTLLSLFLGFSLLHSARAVEYVTLHSGNLLHDIAAGSLVEIVSWGAGPQTGTATSSEGVKVTFPGGSTETFFLPSAHSTTAPFKYFGITRIEIPTFTFSVTCKVTPPSEINAVGPTNILVIPENAPDNYDLIVESSGDLLTWSPVFSQTIVNGAASNFFRARLVKK